MRRTLPLVLVLLLAGSLVPAPGAGAEKVVPRAPGLPTEIMSASAVTVGNTMYIFGGRETVDTGEGPVAASVNTIRRFDLVAGTNQTLAATLPERREATSAVWDGSRAWIFGGADNRERPLPTGKDDIIEFDPATGTVQRSPTLRLPSGAWGTASTMAGNVAYIVGGLNPAGDPNVKRWILRFDPATRTLVDTGVALPHGLAWASLAWTGRELVIVGGLADDGKSTWVSDAVYHYHPDRGTLRRAATLPLPIREASVFVHKTSVYIVGGCHTVSCGDFEGSRALVRYDLATETATTLYPTLPSQRWRGVLGVADGKAYLAGGSHGATMFRDVLEITPGPTEPAAPLNVTAAQEGEAIVVTWEKPPYDGGSAVTGYVIDRRSPGASPVLVAETDASARRFEDATIEYGTAHTYTVRARNAQGLGGASAAPDLRPFRAPDAPRNLTIEPGDGRLVVRWAAPASDGGSGVTGYGVRGAPEGQPTTDLATVSTLEFIHVNLTNGDHWCYDVAGVNAAGFGERAGPVCAAPAELPGTPGRVTWAADGGTINLTWDPPAEDAIASYRVYRGTSTTELRMLTETTARTHRDATVEPGVAYWYAVSAVSPSGESPRTTAVHAAIFTPPPPPTGGSISVDGLTVTLRWTPPASAGGAATPSYLLSRLDAEGAESVVVAELMIPEFVLRYTDRAKMRLATGNGFVVRTTNPAGESAPLGPLHPPEGTFSDLLLGPRAVIVVTPANATARSPVTFDGSLSTDPDGRVAAYRFHFGDGAGTDWVGEAVVTHAYRVEGAYLAILTVRDDDGIESEPASAAVTAGYLGRTPIGMEQQTAQDAGTDDNGLPIPVPSIAIIGVALVIAVYTVGIPGRKR